MEQQKTWVRIAVNGPRIRSGDPYGWRCFVGNDAAETPLKDWEMEGEVLRKVNYIPGTIATGDRHGLVAWIDIFGICSIKDGILNIVLEKPMMPRPNHEAQQ